jgi:hypothetical protein
MNLADSSSDASDSATAPSLSGALLHYIEERVAYLEERAEIAEARARALNALLFVLQHPRSQTHRWKAAELWVEMEQCEELDRARENGGLGLAGAVDFQRAERSRRATDIFRAFTGSRGVDRARLYRPRSARSPRRARRAGRATLAKACDPPPPAEPPRWSDSSHVVSAVLS